MNEKCFYVCSYGGSGSKMLCTALNAYGKTKHIHSRKPPNKLEYIGYENGGNTYEEWFNGVVIPEENLKYYYVIYIYRNPSFSIPSRFDQNPNHLEHIQIDKSIELKDVLDSKKDLYKIREFYDNYTKPNEKRNYKIYCVKYEDIFDKQNELSKLLGVRKLNMVDKSSRKNSNKELDNIYDDLIDEMNKNEFIMIS
tara:strand:- start:2861 stop:3448 length:588 start_codon:yes stop_codon:yes gene_type:complete